MNLPGSQPTGNNDGSEEFLFRETTVRSLDCRVSAPGSSFRAGAVRVNLVTARNVSHVRGHGSQPVIFLIKM